MNAISPERKHLLRKAISFGLVCFFLLTTQIASGLDVSNRFMKQPVKKKMHKHKYREPLFVQKQDTINWKSLKNNYFPRAGWSILKNELVLLPGRKGGDIITKKEYTNFELTLEFKMTDFVNSGIKYFVNQMKNMENGKQEWIGFEYQIIDDFNQDKIAGFNNNKGSTGALYLLCAPNDKNKHLKPSGEWNFLKIKVKKEQIEHWLNGKKIITINTKTPEFRELVQQTKFKNYLDYGNKTGGYILIQDHGSQIHYRNIRIKEI